MVLRTAVVIPCFDIPRTLSQVVKQVVTSTPFPILLIDNGSETPVSHVLYSFEVKQALEQGRIRIVRFETNQGKGAALRYAIQDLVSRGYTHMISMDGDGRQRGDQIQCLVGEALQHPWSMIVGRRNPSARGPASTWLISLSVRFETGMQVKDPQSGFRMYPLFHLQTMKFRTRHYDFELEALIRLMWKGVDVREVDIRTEAYDPAEHNVHFHRFWDSLRISFLNLLLMVVSTVRTHQRPSELGFAVALGVFVGCTPLLGVHTAMALILATVLRLNLAALWLGTRISMPLFLPFVILAEVYIGQNWLRVPSMTGLMSHSLQWLAGSVVLGVLLGVPAGLMTYWVAGTMQRERTARAGNSKRSPILRFVLNRFGAPVTYLILRMVLPVRYLLWFEARKGLNEFYRVLQPSLGLWARHKRIWQHLRRVGEIEIDSFGRCPLSRPTAVLTLSAGLGDWPLAAGTSDVRFIDRSDSPSRVELIPFLGKLAPLNLGAFELAVQQNRPLQPGLGLKVDGEYMTETRPARDYHLKADVAPESQYFEWASRFSLWLEFHLRKTPDQVAESVSILLASTSGPFRSWRAPGEPHLFGSVETGIITLILNKDA